MNSSAKKILLATLVATGAIQMFCTSCANDSENQSQALVQPESVTVNPAELTRIKKSQDYPSGNPQEMARHCQEWDMTKMTFTDSTGSLNYTQGVYNKSSKGKSSLLLFLHGIGERGNDGYTQNRLGVHSMVDYIRANGEKVVLLALQCPSSELWAPLHRGGNGAGIQANPMGACGRIPGLIEEKLKDKSLDIDPDRVYITGLSMGGYGTWDTICRRPDLFAAAIPICGGADPKQAPALKNMAISIFHGSRDGLVPTNLSREMYQALQDAGAKNIKLTIYEGVEHNSWENAYGDPETYKWLFSQKRTKEGAAAKPLPIEANPARQGGGQFGQRRQGQGGQGGFGGGQPGQGGQFGQRRQGQGGQGGFGGGQPGQGGQFGQRRQGQPGQGGFGGGQPGQGGQFGQRRQGQPGQGGFGGGQPGQGGQFGQRRQGQPGQGGFGGGMPGAQGGQI